VNKSLKQASKCWNFLRQLSLYIETSPWLGLRLPGAFGVINALLLLDLEHDGLLAALVERRILRLAPILLAGFGDLRHLLDVRRVHPLRLVFVPLQEFLGDDLPLFGNQLADLGEAPARILNLKRTGFVDELT